MYITMSTIMHYTLQLTTLFASWLRSKCITKSCYPNVHMGYIYVQANLLQSLMLALQGPTEIYIYTQSLPVVSPELVLSHNIIPAAFTDLEQHAWVRCTSEATAGSLCQAPFFFSKTDSILVNSCINWKTHKRLWINNEYLLNKHFYLCFLEIYLFLII